MDSSLMNKSVNSTGLGHEFDNLLQLCKDPETPRGDIGKALRHLVSPEHEAQFKDRAAYWFLRTIACELYQPRNASHFVRTGIDRAQSCPDGRALASTFAHLQVEVLEGRVNRSAASISEGLRQLYALRLDRAKESRYLARST